MKRYILLAEEGERNLISEVEQSLGCSLQDWPVLITGVGAINVIRTLGALDRDTQLLNIGYAGSANFQVGSLIEVSEVRLNHPNVTYPEPQLQLTPLRDAGIPECRPADNLRSAVCYSGCDFVLRSDYRDCVFDMELAFIASMGFRCLSSIKHVSDNLSLHAYHDLTHGVE